MWSVSLNGSSTLNSPEDVTKRDLYSSDEGVMQQYLEDDDKSLNKVSLQYPTLFIESKNSPYRCNYSYNRPTPKPHEDLTCLGCLLIMSKNHTMVGKEIWLRKRQRAKWSIWGTRSPSILVWWQDIVFSWQEGKARETTAISINIKVE